MSLQLAQSFRAGVVNSFRTALNSDILRIYAGSVPANADTALGAQTLLAEPTFNSTSAPSSTDGVLTCNAITTDTSANNAGTPTFARLFQSDGTTLVGQCTVSVTGGGGDIQFAYVPFVAGTPIGVTSLTFTMPA